MRHQFKLAGLALVLAVLVAACGGAAATPTPTAAAKPAVVATAITVLPTPVVTVAPPTAAPATATPVPPPATATPVPSPNAGVVPTPTRQAATPTQAAAAASESNVPDFILNAQRAVYKQKAARITTTLIGEGGSVMTNTVEMNPPDRIRIVAAGFETIAIRGVGAWQKVNGQWQKMPGGAAVADSILSTLDTAAADSVVEDIVVDKVQSLGTENLGGKPMRVYQFASKTTVSGTTVEGTGKVWIGAADGLPYRVEGSSGSGASTTKTQSIYEYDSSIKIEAPM